MKPVLNLNKVQVKVKGRDMPILCDTSLNIFAHEFVVILGHNGSGKSTLIKVLSGELKPTMGRVFIDGTQINKIAPREMATRLLSITQRAEDRLFVDLSLEENINLWESRFPPKERLGSEQIIELTNAPQKFIQMLKEPVGNLSGGEKQSLLIALALAHPPRVLFLDEHTSALDPKAAIKIMRDTDIAVRTHKVTTIMVTHRLDEAIKYGNRLIILNEGKIVFDQQKTRPYTSDELKGLME